MGVQINFSFMIHLMPTWYFESFWTDHPYDNIINIKVHKYFAVCLKISQDWFDSTELIRKKGFWLAAHNRGTPEFNTSEQRLYSLQVSSDSTENKLNPIQFLIYYDVQFA